MTAAIVVGLAAGHAASAQEPPLKFLHVLQENGYGDMAAEYLKILQKKGPGMPQAVADVWDLEMSKSLRAAANEAFDAREHEQLMEESQTHLTKFIKEKPDHPDFLAAVTLWSDFPVKHALQLIRAAKAAADKDKQAVLLNEARYRVERSARRVSAVHREVQDQAGGIAAEGQSVGPERNRRRAARNGIQRARGALSNRVDRLLLRANLSGSERSGTCGSSDKSVPRV